ncbi:hypothetical protein [Streptomyces sp. W1SF4]|uniref:hypothetical protein n=1 Tax=Streptomyces sp. W1SF4 TaxID=2305220 RepID=UPI000F6E0631|nr:hypothetical protein [Streptomyces sp. W1SF4]AZM90164.1 hypothetical protein D1J60_18230 [Streptomyces sp. W1SF4]
MDKIYSVVGSTLAGLFTGYLAMGLWWWGATEDGRCESGPTICLPVFQFIAFASWLAVTAVFYVVALRLLDVRPRVATVPACLALQMYALALLAPLSVREYPEPSLLSFAALAAGPGLVALCAFPEWRRRGLAATAVLMAGAFVAYGCAEGFPW